MFRFPSSRRSGSNCTAFSKDHLTDYTEQGKRSYYIASTFEEDPYREEAPVLRRLSEQFELCAYGLNQVRQEWQRARPRP